MEVSHGDLSYEDVLEIMAGSRRACDALAKAIGKEHASEAVAMLQSQSLEGELGDEIRDFFLCEIGDQGESVWVGSLREYDSHDREEVEWPIGIMKYEGVFFISALEIDNMGFFSTKAAALKFVRRNWPNVA